MKNCIAFLMEFTIAPLLLLICVAFLLRPVHCDGFMCKKGQIQSANGHKSYENITAEYNCEDMVYCMTATCTVENGPGLAFTTWDCVSVNDKPQCIEKASMQLKKYKNVHCNCEFGRAFETMGNAKHLPATPPPTAPLKCSRGAYNDTGYGKVDVDDQCRKEDNFCYVANCKTKNTSDMVWGCAESEDCDAVARKNSVFPGINYTCTCNFGGKWVNNGNKNLTVPPLWKPLIVIKLEMLPIDE